MSEKPISPLRRRMIEDMSVRNFVEKTRNDYIRHVRTFTAFLGRRPPPPAAVGTRKHYGTSALPCTGSRRGRRRRLQADPPSPISSRPSHLVHG